jgi:hypothetical protein
VALLRTHPPDVLQLPLELQEPALDLAPIGLELGFAGTSRPDSASELGHRCAPSSEPGQHVLQLRQFYLKVAFAATSMAGKNVENKLGAVDDPDWQGLFKVSELGGAEVVIEQDKGGLCRFRNGRDLFDLAFADQRGRIRFGPSLQDFGDHLGPRAGNQLAKFREGRAAVDRRGATALLCYGIGAHILGSFSRQGRGTRQSLWPGDELDSDQERSFCLNARSFQTILMCEACCKGLHQRELKVAISYLWTLKEAQLIKGTWAQTRFVTDSTLRASNQ